MLKKYKILLFAVLIVLNTSNVFSQTISPTKIPTPTTKESGIIQDLKDKVANKVEEIRKKNNRAIAGVVIEVAGDSFKIKTPTDEDFEIILDEALTKYYQISGAQQKEIDKDIVEEDDYLIATGVIADKTITANSVFIDQRYITGSGKITEVDKDNFTIQIVSSDKSIFILNIETSTKQQIVNIKTLELEKVGFSKLIVGDSIHFVVKNTGSETNNEYSAEKILIVPQEYFIK